MATLARAITAGLALASFALASPNALQARQASPDSCPGYTASDVQQSPNGLTAKLSLAGAACNVYGEDLTDLTLTVEYQSKERLHVLIQDAANRVYQVPDSVFTRPPSGTGYSAGNSSDLEFKYVESPFSFSVVRKSTQEVLFDTSAASLIFESQYLRLRTSLPQNPSLYGLGEHSDNFMLNTTNYTVTMWNRDAYGTPQGSNLYGEHPVYFDHRGQNGTHAVFLLNSNGMDIKIDTQGGQHLEYNTLGGVLDFYFLAGPTPVKAAEQYSEVVGKSALQPYWGFGYQQCRYGMQDVYEVAEVVANYSAANIPLEVMWTDIDYMYLRRVFTLDPIRFPLKLMRELVDTLHSRGQQYIVMVDPAVAVQDYPGYNEGVAAGAFLKTGNGSIYNGVVWPGVTAFPDWFAPGTQPYWNDQFSKFFDPNTGVDIDALWIDMNEASNFCNYPCTNPEAEAKAMGNPPQPPAVRLGSPRPIEGFPQDFQPQCKAQVTFNVNASTFYGENILFYGSAITIGAGDVGNAAPLDASNYPIWAATIDMPADTRVTYQYVRKEPDGSFVYENTNRTITTGPCGSTNQTTNDNITTASPPQTTTKKRAQLGSGYRAPVTKRQATGNHTGLPGRDLINPPYTIDNDAGGLSNKTIDTDIVHYNGLVEYDTHNIYGAMMSEASRIAMLNRRPTKRPMIITRSTFAGSGRQVGHWLGDNLADWEHYLYSIKGLIEFVSLYQVPMAGSDVCGFGGNTNELLCARWAVIGAFQTFYRNHQEVNKFPLHEFYRWPLVAEAARNAIAIRYKLLDYIYTAFYQQSKTGTPCIQPMFFAYPEDPNTNSLGYQFFYGPGLLVAPVTEENSTTATVYLPKDTFYDYYTGEKIEGNGETTTIPNVDYTSIPLFYKGGQILAERVNGAMTTKELRTQDFNIVIAPDASGKASGSLYLDDGESVDQTSTSEIEFTYDNGRFEMKGTFGYDAGNQIRTFTILGQNTTTSRMAAAETSVPLTGPYASIV